MSRSVFYSPLLGLFIPFALWAQPTFETGAAEENLLAPLIMGLTPLGERRMELSSQDFEIKVDKLSPGLSEVPSMSFRLVEESLQWVRLNRVLLLPRMHLEIEAPDLEGDLSAQYLGTRFVAQRTAEGRQLLRFHYLLFTPRPITLFSGQGPLATVYVQAQTDTPIHLIDYSCSPYSLRVTGLDAHFLSAGCLLERSGRFGREQCHLKVLLATPNLGLGSQVSTPLTLHLDHGQSSQFQLQSLDDQTQTVSVQAQVPAHVPRLRLATGFGPHSLFYREQGLGEKTRFTSPFLLYGRLTLGEETSFRFFNGLFYHGSLFNKWGLYFAYDMASALDYRLTVTPLLGLQTVTYRSEFSSRESTKGIYPQGFEFVYRHPFGLENYSLTYGVFLSPITNEHYRNTWLRFGRRVFWEINYLSWRDDSFYVKAWGLSLGFPIATFF